jgi:hypothetical protein
MANHHELPYSAPGGEHRSVTLVQPREANAPEGVMNREARGSAGIAGLMLVAIPGVEAMLTACVVSSRR